MNPNLIYSIKIMDDYIIQLHCTHHINMPAPPGWLTVAAAGAFCLAARHIYRRYSARGSSNPFAASATAACADADATAARIAHLKTQLKAERAGRTAAERQLRDLVVQQRRQRQQQQDQQESSSSSAPSSFTFHPVAYARTLFVDRRGCPRQGALTDALGFLDFAKHVPRASLEGLSQCSHVWVVFVFDRNTNLHKADATQRTFRAKVRAPLLGGKKTVGLFATRTPHRPNAIGLSLCQLEAVDLKRGLLRLSGVDLCDGTPILDVKPYNPHDRPPRSLVAFPPWVPVATGAGGADGSGGRGAPLVVRFSPEALEGLSVALPRLRKDSKASKVHFADIVSAQAVLRQVLRLDVRGLNQERGGDGGTYEVRLGRLRATFTVRNGELVVDSCSRAAPHEK